ncbi:PEP/pyruvate-binding domain-containing protein [Pseudonocardia dioxanivorans]|uniref:PEP/pyruvate-binding domain-containing protein n=1 Tax=Pseudonocardia dioxanivorans TaxID=240495 RepID=UPI0007C7B35E|nr:PEP/pyruvate-binding domain-containing protein [Pseudonocardia dioxanivorans]
MGHIRAFSEIGRGDVETAGGKGANLGELTRGGLPVPPGFVVTTDAYRAFVDATGIGPRVLELATPPPGSTATDGDVDRSADAIRALFRAEIPAAIADEIRAAHRMLGDGPVAVRSSATAEDLEGASFAGQQDTFLDVRGDEALLSPPSAPAGPRCGRRAPWPTARGTASHPPTSRSRSSCSAWSTPTRRV